MKFPKSQDSYDLLEQEHGGEPVFDPDQHLCDANPDNKIIEYSIDDFDFSGAVLIFAAISN